MATISFVPSASPLWCGTLQYSDNISPRPINSLSRYRESILILCHVPPCTGLSQDYSTLHHPSLPKIHLPKGIKLLKTKNDMEEGIKECESVGVCPVEENGGELKPVANDREDDLGLTMVIDGEDIVAELEGEVEDFLEHVEETNSIANVKDDFKEISQEPNAIKMDSSPVKTLKKDEDIGEEKLVQTENSTADVEEDFSQISQAAEAIEKVASPANDPIKNEAIAVEKQESPDTVDSSSPPQTNNYVETSSPETGGLAVQAMASLSCGLGCLLHGSAMVFPAVAIPRYFTMHLYLHLYRYVVFAHKSGLDVYNDLYL